MDKSKVIVKKRNWAFVGYPESLPPNWKDILTATGLPCAISPLHDKDIEPTGEVKKPHYHFIICYNGPTSFNVVKRLTDSLNCPIPIALDSVQGMYRYHCHLDNPDKYQYEDKERSFLNGFNLMNFVDITKAEIQTIKKALQRLCLELDIIEYSDLMNYVLDNGTEEEYEVASSHTIFFNSFLSSRRHKAMEFKRDLNLDLESENEKSVSSDLNE